MWSATEALDLAGTKRSRDRYKMSPSSSSNVLPMIYDKKMPKTLAVAKIFNLGISITQHALYDHSYINTLSQT